MSYREAEAPDCVDCETPAVSQLISAKRKNMGGTIVARALPSIARRSIGPFVFFDHMGPITIPAGEAGEGVRPHPHIHLATVTYLFEGAIVHRDSLGVVQVIEPGAINWMTAGRGITHSERPRPEDKTRETRLDGIQLWLALPTEHEDCEPAFHHHPKESFPTQELEGVSLRVLIGEAYGASSPVAVFSPMLYLDAQLPPGSSLPIAPSQPERAVFVAKGSARIGEERGAADDLFVLAPDREAIVHAGDEGCRLIVFGGEPLGQRHIWWNFVSSSRERIEQAKADWRDNRFPLIPDDQDERIPLPE